MRRVLHVIGKMDRAGAETLIMNIYRKIDREKIQFDFLVFTNEKGDYDDEIVSLGGKIYRLPKFAGYNYGIFYRKFKCFFSEQKYEIVHGHIGSLAPLYLSIAKKTGAYTIAHSHASKSNKLINRVIFSLFSFRVRYIADYFFACSKQAGIDRFGERIVSSRKFSLLKNGIDSDLYIYSNERHNELKEKFGLNNKIVYGHVGRFSEEKNHNFLLEVFAQICKKNSDSVLILVGRGPEEKTIQNKILMMGLERKVVFLGVRNDIPDLMNLFDVFIFPSFYEGLGIVGIEAQAAGLPCFFSQAIPNEAIITDNVFKCDLGLGAEAWADYILKSIDKYERKNTNYQIKDNGYDIMGISVELMNFYIEKCK